MAISNRRRRSTAFEERNLFYRLILIEILRVKYLLKKQWQ
jgi:hypothetical protein